MGGAAHQGVHEVVSARQVRAGDEVTEVDTPGGPWYRVLRVNEAGGSLLVGDGDGDAVGVEVDVGDWNSAVLRRAPSKP